MRHGLKCVVPIFLLLCCAVGENNADQPIRELRRLRRPVAAALTADGKWLLVANRDAGSISLLDAQTLQVLREVPVSKRLADLAVAADGTIAVVDEKTHELIVLRPDSDSLNIVGRIKTPHTPVSVTFSGGAKSCLVAALWSRQLHVVDTSIPAKPGIARTIDLPFSPREQQLLPDGKTLVVADSFGGKLAALDTTTGVVLSTRELEGHNLRGFALSRDGMHLLISHQVLNQYAATSGFAVHWGGVMKNVVSEIAVADLLTVKQGSIEAAETAYLGIPDRAAGDPGDLLVCQNGHRVVAFSGTSEIAISRDGRSYHDRVAVGRRPVALATSHDEKTVFVAGMFNDSISVVSLGTRQVTAEIALGPQPPLDLPQRGEMLFYDAKLSSDGWYSCHSCHSDGHSNGLLNDNFSDGSYASIQSVQYDSPLRVSRGGSKRVLSLLGTTSTGPWAWDASQISLWGQIRKSVEITMQGPSPPEDDVIAIQQFFYTLEPPPGLAVARGQVDRQAAARGKKLFVALNCADCHRPTLSYTTPDSYDVGLQDQSGSTQFNPPSLRGVSHRHSFFHDGRAKSLRDLFEKYEHNLQRRLSGKQLSDLVSFLETL